MAKLSSKHSATLARAFAKPTSSKVIWSDARGLLRAVGCTYEKGKGSRRRFALRDAVLTIHEPHPQKEVPKYAVELIRDYLTRVGVTPPDEGEEG